MRHQSIHRIAATLSLALLLCSISQAQEIGFDKTQYLELTTDLRQGDPFDIAVDQKAWVDFNANDQIDEGELFIPDKAGRIQRFISKAQGGKTFKIYGPFKEVILRRDQITSIDLHRMTQLTYLELKDNKLTTIDVGALTNLEQLVLRENELSTLDISHQSKLLVLEIIYNRFETIDLSHNPNLNMLGIAGNRFGEQGIAQMVTDLPQRSRENPGEIFGYFPEESERNVITKEQVIKAQGKRWSVYMWSIAANNWIPYAGVVATEDIVPQDAFRSSYKYGTLFITGTQTGEEVAVYDVSGVCIVTFTGDAETTLYHYPLPDGSYIVKQGGKSAQMIVTTN